MSAERQHERAFPEILVIGIRRERDEYIVELTGELDLSGVALVAEAFASALETDARKIVLDLRNLEFLDSTGIHAILEVERLIAEQERSFSVVRGQRQVQRIFEIAGLTDRLTFIDG